MHPEDLKPLIEAGAESPRLDYKASASCDHDGLAKDVLAMTNIKDGGRIIIGVKEKPDGSFEPTGVQDEHLTTYAPVDVLKDKVGAYADPHVDFDVETVELEGKKYVVITVREFEEEPVICKKSSPLKLDQTRELVEGRMYTRTRRGRPASECISSSVEMRRVLKIAIDKGMSELHRRGYSFAPPSQQAERGFDAQIADLS